MPNKVRLREGERILQKYTEGPTFEEWKAEYLARHGGATDTLRDTGVADNGPAAG